MRAQIRRRGTRRNPFCRRGTLSEFPDELLLKILSFLPSKDVIATSAISKRWKSLWKEVNTFRYDDTRPTFKMFALFIRSKSSVDILQLKFSPGLSVTADINPLVDDAVARSLRELRIEMLYISYELPQSLYFYPQLETLILQKLSLEDIPSNVSLIGVKKLHLLSVRFSSDESVIKLLSICPLLEDLVVRRSLYTNVMIFTIDVPTLKSLCIYNWSGKSRPEGVHGFVINAPALRCFSIKDSFSNYLRFGNMPELVKASVNIVCDQPEDILGSLVSTRYLSLCLQSPYLHLATSFLFLDHLELYACPSHWCNLLKDTPKLRVLKLYQNNETAAPWNQPNSLPECLSSHLEIFEWRQYNGTDEEREAAKYILANASCLKKATFFSKSAKKVDMLKELESVARGSKTCMLVFE
ncbi:putative FBD-associated F-box protein [Raphanus sativus]|uniref:FBD-associated F-box protein At1g50980 n=1 Tax=Raphanus sativus TaxID=3726 RepID=A0A6J0MZX4_RAPSA|nr:putative FBD-associated F-box protein At1g50980 [Raphanus sativus]KAJ4917717.1 putative FBD-associated F-box protein [Raphanus sativus]